MLVFLRLREFLADRGTGDDGVAPVRVGDLLDAALRLLRCAGNDNL